MNVRTLEYFLKVAEIGSLKGAAEAIPIAQPALSRQIAGLEDEFDAQLFVRHRRGMSLTEAGEQLRLHAERFLGELGRARDVVAAAGHEPSGSVALELPTSMLYVLSSSLVPVPSYLRTWPNVSLRVHEAIGHVVEDLLRNRRVDVALLISDTHDLENVDLTPLVEEGGRVSRRPPRRPTGSQAPVKHQDARRPAADLAGAAE